MRHGMPFWISAAGGALLAASVAGAADPGKPHPHQGIVPAFEGEPPRIDLSEDERRDLDRGKAVITTLPGDAGGRGMAIQDVHAPPEVVWDRIGAFSDYPRMVGEVVECEPYFVEGDDVRVRFKISVYGIPYVYYIRHVFRPEKGYVTWTLDYTRESDLDDSVGYWAVTPHPDEPGWSRVFYAIDMRTRGFMPGFVRRFIARRGVSNATGWVKHESEAMAERQSARPGETDTGS